MKKLGIIAAFVSGFFDSSDNNTLVLFASLISSFFACFSRGVTIIIILFSIKMENEGVVFVFYLTTF